jgi:hypothetical protein
MKVTRFEHHFIDHFPDRLEPGVLYVSLPFASVAHGCACGCGKEVITPLSPTDWQLTFDGKSISLYPSIGNWSFPCRSHYWIKQGAVEWSYHMSRTEIEAGRKHAQAAKRAYYNEGAAPAKAQTSPAPHAKSSRERKGAWSRFVDWLNEK